MDVSGVVLNILHVTYLCWIQAARIVAPEAPRAAPLQFSSVILVSNATGLLASLSPLNVNLDNVLLFNW